MKNEPIYCKANFRYLLGIDEAGRGPLAGPLALCAMRVKDKKVLRQFAGIKDSKKLLEKKREEWFAKLENAQTQGHLSFEVTLVPPAEIDKKGISACLKDGVARVLARFAPEKENTLVLLDGTLYAPRVFVHQITIIKGDEKERVIAMSSVAAKVIRDREMLLLAKKYPQYGFEKHKGYATAAHYAAIARFGILPVHRRTFL